MEVDKIYGGDFLFLKIILIIVVNDMGTNCGICSDKCYGINDYHGSCCSIENRDFIIGPHHDSQDFVERLSIKFGRKINREDVFIDYEEGKKLFPFKKSWQNQQSFPALRIDFNNPKLSCIFYNTTIRACTVYELRPETCMNYECEYLSQNS